MELEVDQTTSLEMMRSEFIPSTQFHMEFKFEFEFITSRWIRHTGSTTDDDVFAGEKSWVDSSSTVVAGGEARHDANVLEAVLEAIEARVPDEEDRQRMVESVMHRVRMCRFYQDHIPALQHHVVRFRVGIQVESVIVTVYEGMVPAAKSSLGMLEKYEEDVTDDFGDERRCCSICLEEFLGGGSGGALLRMPCLHVFHGDCIKEWLRRSHYCPVCRYEMPMV